MRLKSLAFFFFAGLTAPAYAYIGPGLGAGTIGVILGIFASVILAIFAIVWYPAKRLLKKLRKPRDEDTSRGPEKSSDNIASDDKEGP
ncbi:MAG: hypothetical protein OEQ74_01560 [Gammaproteobacteria bacterium]|nr:hypothetical protein [Gammaproteobacteria bacterium]